MIWFLLTAVLIGGLNMYYFIILIKSPTDALGGKFFPYPSFLQYLYLKSFHGISAQSARWTDSDPGYVNEDN